MSVVAAVKAQDLAALKRALAKHRGPIPAAAAVTAAQLAWKPGLALLVKHGVDLNASYRNYRPLHALIQEKPHAGWSSTRARVKCLEWLLAHGADPDPVFAANGETPLHVAAASWDVAMTEALVSHGADPARPRADGRTPYAVAELNGNHDVAAWLLAHGAPGTILPVDQLVAACSRGDRSAADKILAKRPELRNEIGPEHYSAFYRAAERNHVAALDAMLACGFDPNRPDDSIGKTVLHIAAMEGWPEAARLLLARGASVTVRDREFNAPPLIWAAEGSRTSRTDRDHAAVGRLLLDAGSPVEWQAGDEPAEGITDIVNVWRGAVSLDS